MVEVLPEEIVRLLKERKIEEPIDRLIFIVYVAAYLDACMVEHPRLFAANREGFEREAVEASTENIRWLEKEEKKNANC